MGYNLNNWEDWGLVTGPFQFFKIVQNFLEIKYDEFLFFPLLKVCIELSKILKIGDSIMMLFHKNHSRTCK